MTTRSAHCHPGDSVLGVFSLQEAGHGSKFNLVQLSTSLQKKKKCSSVWIHYSKDTKSSEIVLLFQAVIK